MDIAGELLRCVAVELQSLAAVDFRIGLPEFHAKGCQIELVLFNQPVHGFLNKGIGIFIIAARDFFTNALLEVGRQSEVHSHSAAPKVDRTSYYYASGDRTSGHEPPSPIRSSARAKASWVEEALRVTLDWCEEKPLGLFPP
jgi:hypothetical protein